jgi:hypothetical protein
MAALVGLLAPVPPGGRVERGVGAPTVKSLALLSVSCAPADFLRAAVVLLSVAVGPVPSKQFAPEVPEPKPTKSIELVAKLKELKSKKA